MTVLVLGRASLETVQDYSSCHADVEWIKPRGEESVGLNGEEEGASLLHRRSEAMTLVTWHWEAHAIAIDQWK